MESYKLAWKESVYKDLRKIPQSIVARIIHRSEMLPDHPIPIDSKKLKNTKHTYRIRVGDYRMIYQVNARAQEILICRVRHRKDVYQD